MKSLTPNPEILKTHRQIHNDSCIAMSVEYVLKELGIVSKDFFDYQNDRGKDKLSDWVTQIYKDNIGFKKEEGLNNDELLNRIDSELSDGRRIIISLQIGANQWHMYVIYEKQKDDQYRLVTSTPNMGKSQIEIKNLRQEIPNMNGVDLITHKNI